jgi:hypothetical protein
VSTILILGLAYDIQPLPGPDAFAVAEEFLAARDHALEVYGADAEAGRPLVVRVTASALGLSTRIGREAGVSYAGCGYSMLAYGGAIYSYLRSKGASASEIMEAASPCAQAILLSIAPRENEVQAAVNFTGPQGVPSI